MGQILKRPGKAGNRGVGRGVRGPRGIAPLLVTVVVVIVVAAGVVGGLYVTGYLKLGSSPGPVSATFNVSFTETGLALGGTWKVTVGGATMTSTSSSVLFKLSNGSYSYTINSSGYTPAPASGSFSVTGVAWTQAVVFTSNVAAALNYTTAAPKAQAEADSYGGGSWVGALAIAVAITSPAMLSTSVLNLSNISGEPCTTTWFGGITQFSVPATSSGAAAGASNAWIFVFSKEISLTYQVLITDVFGGSATNLANGSGTGCVGFTFINMAGIIDSSVAVKAANAAGGTAWLVQWPDPDQRMFLAIGAIALVDSPAEWNVTYNTCSISATSGTGYWFSSDVNGSSGRAGLSDSGTAACTAPAHSGPPAIEGVGWAVSQIRSELAGLTYHDRAA